MAGGVQTGTIYVPYEQTHVSCVLLLLMSSHESHVQNKDKELAIAMGLLRGRRCKPPGPIQGFQDMKLALDTECICQTTVIAF